MDPNLNPNISSTPVVPIDPSVIPPEQATQSEINDNHQTVIQPQTAITESEKSKKKSRWKKAILIIGGFVLLGIVLAGFLLFRGAKDAPVVQEKITKFMQNVSMGNYESAYALVSKEFKETTPMDEFSRTMSLFKAQFTGFQSQEQVGFNIKAYAGQPTYYEYSAVVNYSDGDIGELIAILVKEDNDYKILSIEVNVSLDRGEKFQQSDQNSILGASTTRK